MALLQVINNETLAQREAQELDAAEAERQSAVVLTALAAQIQRQWQKNRDHKPDIETVMLECLRQRNGEYSPAELSDIRQQGGSEIYMMLTAAKVRAAASWISDIMLPAGDKAWGIDPTPVADLPPQIKQTTIQLLTAEVQQAQAQGVNPDPQQIEERTLEFRKRMLDALQKQADKAAQMMEDKIEDQLAESGWAEALEEFIDDFCTFPGAILKGPVYQRRKGLKWDENGNPQVVDEIVERDVRVSPFDIYPSPGAVTIDDGNLIELCRYSPADLWGLIGAPGYDEPAIREVLTENQGGYLKDWTSLQSNARAHLEGRDDDDDLIDALHYWGTASGQSLLDWGMDESKVDDPLRYYQIEAILIGRHLIRVKMNADPLGRRPYYKASFQNKPGSFWGISPPMLMKDIARICNGTARALMNNMGMASGPMGWVNTDRLPQGEVVTGFHPWKMFQTVSSTTAGSEAPIGFFQPNSNAKELLEVYNQFEAKADDATNIPRYMYGNEKVSGAGQTAQGLSMLIESASKGIKAAVRHIDMGVIRPRIERQYHYNMLYIDDPAIKGDLKVVARGSSALIAKAATQARRNEFLAVTANETDAMILGIDGRAELLRRMAADMDMPNVVPDDEKVQQQIAMMQQPQQQQDPRAQIEEMRIQWEQKKLEMVMQDQERERQVKLQLAQFGLQGDMMELAGKKELTLEQIKARLGETAMRENNANRRFVAEKELKAAYGSGI